MATQQQADDLFVIRIDSSTDRRALESRVGDIGSIEAVPRRDDLVLLRVRDTSSGARATWERIQSAIGDLPIAPVILDDRGRPSYPTGRVSVRFKETPEPAALEQFAEKLNLRLVSVSKFVAAQVMFEPKHHTDYLPDIVESVAADDQVDRAWPESLAGYRRG